MNNEWYYLEGTRRVGPVTERELVQALASQLSQDTKVWHPSLPDWIRAADAPELRERIPPPSPSPSSLRTNPPVPAPTPSQPAPPIGPVLESEPPHSSSPFVLYFRCLHFLKGRLSRKEYTILILSALGIGFGGAIAVALIYAASGATPDQMATMMGDVFSLFWLVVGLPPVIGGTIQRLRDVGKKAWYMLVFLIPCAGFIMMLFLMREKGMRDVRHEAASLPQGASGHIAAGGVEFPAMTPPPPDKDTGLVPPATQSDSNHVASTALRRWRTPAAVPRPTRTFDEILRPTQLLLVAAALLGALSKHGPTMLNDVGADPVGAVAHFMIGFVVEAVIDGLIAAYAVGLPLAGLIYGLARLLAKRT